MSSDRYAYAATASSEPFVVLQAGEFDHPSSGRAKITEADLDQAVANFEALKARGHEIPIDYDHSFATGGESKAAGWITELFRKGKELLARVNWTEKAKEMIGGDEYRHISAEFDTDWADENGEARGFSLLAAGLTNRPFLKGMGAVALSEPSTTVSSICLNGTLLDPGVQYAWTGGFQNGGIVPQSVTVPLYAGEQIFPLGGAGTSAPVTITLSGTGLRDAADIRDKMAEKPADPTPEKDDAKVVTLSEADHTKLVEASDQAKTLAEENTKLTERVDALETSLLSEQVSRDLDRARREGRIKADDETTEKWQKRYTDLGRETARELLFELPAETVPISARGHGEGKPESTANVPEGAKDPERYELAQRAAEIAEEKDITLAEAASMAYAEVNK